MYKLIVLFFIGCNLMLGSSFARADICPIADEIWLSPRTGMSVLNNTGIRTCVLSLLNDPKQQLIISYPNNDESAIDAAELRQWLLALALPAARIVLKNAPANTSVQLETQTNP